MASGVETGNDILKAECDESAKEARFKKYKNVAKHEEMRRRRTESSVELRKQRREEVHMKRRNVANYDEEDSEPSETLAGDEKAAEMSPGHKAAKEMNPEEVVAILKANPTLEQLQHCFEVTRRMLSRQKNPPVKEVIQSGLLIALVRALYVEDDKVRLEAAWALTNIASGTSDQTMAVVNEGAVNPLVQLVGSKNLMIAEQATWAVANIAGDSSALRDEVIACGIVPQIELLISHLPELTTTFARTLAWTFSNLCRHKHPPVDVDILAHLAPGIAALMCHKDAIVRTDACWALSYMTDGSDAQIEVAHRFSCIDPAISMLKANSESEMAPALRAVGNFATGNDTLTQVVVDKGVLKLICKIISSGKSSSVVKECCWLLSNVIAGTREQIQAVIDAGLIPVLMRVLHEGDSRGQLEASWAVANLSQGGVASQVLQLSRTGYFEIFCDLLKSTNINMLINILEVVYSVLLTLSSVGSNSLVEAKQEIESCGGLDAIESLQEHQNQKVYELAYKIIEEFFSNDDEEENEVHAQQNDAPFEF